MALKDKRFLEKIGILLIPVIFFLIMFFGLGDYGINWDEPVHYMRGQAYLNFFLTGGQTRYPEYLGSNPSQFQNRSNSAEYFLENDSGHPPLNGILASIFNLIFFQKLNILGDIESYHLFNILAGTLLVGVVAVFAYRNFGFFASLISSLSLIMYPLFFSETHFNIKDPAEAAFFGLAVLAFFYAVNSWSWKWLLVFSISTGLALGTKFNILFLPFIVLPYLFFKIFFLDRGKVYPGKKFLLTLIAAPIIILVIFVGSWPYLWADPVNNFLKVLDYYKVIGTGFNYQTAKFYLPLGFNSYPVFWILYTTPPFILVLTFIGSVAAIFKYREKGGVAVLWLLWLIVPILRVTLPGSSIYGGVRQIMEYIPALALISGLGADFLRQFILKKVRFLSPNLLAMFFLVGFVQVGLVLAKNNPNGNVYFNQLIGGLAGAKQADIPSWGNSYGNAYMQGIKWLNTNAEPNAQLSLVQGTGQNIARSQLRKDINFNNTHWSGTNREGEYLMELNYQGIARAYPYVWEYLEKFLIPAYEVKVDGVAIAKIWKNDLAHTKLELQKPEIKYQGKMKVIKKENSLELQLDSEQVLTRLALSYQLTEGCVLPKGTIEVAASDGKYNIEPESYPVEQVTEKNRQKNAIYFYFPGRLSKSLRLVEESPNSCLFNNPQITLTVLEK